MDKIKVQISGLSQAHWDAVKELQVKYEFESWDVPVCAVFRFGELEAHIELPAVILANWWLDTLEEIRNLTVEAALTPDSPNLPAED